MVLMIRPSWAVTISSARASKPSMSWLSSLRLSDLLCRV